MFIPFTLTVVSLKTSFGVPLKKKWKFRLTATCSQSISLLFPSTLLSSARVSVFNPIWLFYYNHCAQQSTAQPRFVFFCHKTVDFLILRSVFSRFHRVKEKDIKIAGVSLSVFVFKNVGTISVTQSLVSLFSTLLLNRYLFFLMTRRSVEKTLGFALLSIGTEEENGIRDLLPQRSDPYSCRIMFSNSQ